jgi:signal transduction histidine kinase
MIIGLGSVIILSGMQLNAQTLARHENELTIQAHLIANALREPLEHGDEHPGARSLDALIRSYAQGIGGRATLFDAQLNLLASSEGTPVTTPVARYAEWLAAPRGDTQATIRRDAGDEWLFVAAPIVGGEHGESLGVVQLAVPMAPIYAEMTGTWLGFLGIGLIVLVGTAFASILLARQIAVPIEQLTATTERIAAGHLDERIVPAGPREIRRLGTTFNRMTERVQEMIAQQRAFVDNAAHELRSPLTSLRLRIEMLQTRGKQNGELTERYLAQMEREVSYLQRLVDNLLALATVENSAPVVSPQPIDLAPILYDVADEMSEIAQHAGVTLRTKLPDHLPPRRMNADQMRSVVRNLLDNAIKYTPRGGTVTLTAYATRAQVEIKVTDTGRGIPAEALPHLFERFYRVDPARARDVSSAHPTSGTGLGLALVQAIVQRHGGSVQVPSRVGAGSTFVVQLPVSEPAPTGE